MVKRLRVVTKRCLNWIFLVKLFSPDVLGTQIKNIKMRSSKPIIKNTTQKVMVNYCFGRRFHDLKYFEVGIFFFMFLEFIINLKVPLWYFLEKHQFHVIPSYFELILDNYMFNISTCTLLTLSSKLCRLLLNLGNIDCLALKIDVFFKCWFFPSQIQGTFSSFIWHVYSY